ncbi:MAG: hypothetical protein MK085_12215, partial [Phycisphaerales bacterium]|nr:hypothetical protein [Phycisphaerales bacterium]
MKFRISNASGINWNASLIVSLLAITTVVLVGLSAVPGLVSAAFTPNQDTNTSAALEDMLPKHDEMAAVYRDRFVGRSPFFVPPRPPGRPRARPTPQPRGGPAPGPAAPPPGAGPAAPAPGAKPTSLLGSSVYFRDSGNWVEVGAEENGVKVLGIVDTWTVSLGHRGGEYDVSIWGEREDEFFTKRYEGTLKSSGFVAGGGMASRGTPP